MCNILENLNTYSSLITAIATIGLIWATLKIIKKSPNISIYVKPGLDNIQYVNLVIENIGNGYAYETKMEILKDIDFKIPNTNGLSNIPFIKHQKDFAPSQKIESFILDLSKFTEKDQKDFKIKVTYYGSRNKILKYFLCKYSEIFHIDISSRLGRMEIRTAEPIKEISKTLIEMKNILKKM